MDNLLVWLLIFAGAAIGLLATFLVASERELKKTRREVEALAANPDGSPSDPSIDQSVESASAGSQPSAEIIATQRRLEEEIAALSGKLEVSQRTVSELQVEQSRFDSAQSEILRLRADNQRLQDEFARVDNQLQATANQPVGSSPLSPQLSERQSQLQTENSELRSQLDASQAQVRELEMERRELSAAAPRESSFKERQQELEGQIVGLENELSAAKAKNDEFKAAYDRSAELERLHHAAQAENRRLEQENSRWQERLAQSQEYGRRLVSLRQEFNDLQEQQATLVQMSQAMQAKLAAVTRNFAVAPEEISGTATPHVARGMQRSVIELGGEAIESAEQYSGDHRTPPSTMEPVLQPPSDAAVESGDQHAPTDAGPMMPAASAGKTDNKAGVSVNGNRRVGILAGILILAIAGAFAGGFFNMSTDKSASRLNPPAAVSSAVAAKDQPETIADGIEPSAAQPTEAPTSVATIAEGQNLNTPKLPEVKSSKSYAGNYEVIHRTQVYSGPSESTRLVANIEPGTKINVVNSRDGWLEVRSKHGRPPGFIRREAAAKTARN